MLKPKDDAAARQLDHYASLESMEGLVESAPIEKKDVFSHSRPVVLLNAFYPGVLVAGTIAIAATFLSQTYNSPVMLFALLIGIAFHFLHEDGRCKAGIEFSARTILRIGVALLGARITTGQIASLGVAPFAMVIAGVATTILFGFWASNRLGLDKYFGILSGGAVAICGASAALAISVALPKFENKERDTVLTVVGVTTLSTIAMVIYPLIAKALHFSDAQAGLFLGGTIHDVAQVVGAGYMISQEAGDISTYVKLLRVAMLIPVVLCISVLIARNAEIISDGSAPRFPLFLIFFVAFVGINSFLPVPQAIINTAGTISSWCLVTAIAALGMKTSLRDLVKVGWLPVGLMVAETLWIGLLVLGFIILSR